MQSDHIMKKIEKNNTFRSEEGISHITLLIKSAEIKRNWCKVREKNRHSYFFFYLKERGKYMKKKFQTRVYEKLDGKFTACAGCSTKKEFCIEARAVGRKLKIHKIIFIPW